MQRICALAAAIAGCIVLGAVWWFDATTDSVEVDEPKTPREPLAAEREALDAVVAEVAEQSRTGARGPVIQAAPRSLPREPSAPRTGVATSLPPAGYEFVEHHGEIQSHRYQRTPAEFESPSAGPPDWLGAVDALPRLVAQAEVAGRDWSFGWIALGPESRLAEVETSLAALGVDVVGSAGPLLRARLPGDRARLEVIAALPPVLGLGSQPVGAKLPDSFAERARSEPANALVPVFVTLMADDTDSRWRHELERLGVVVGRYDADTRAYVANVRVGSLETVALADFVQFVEPVGVVEATLDTAVPGMGADFLRTYDESLATFTGTGGAGVPIGVMDSGLNTNHPDIVSNRDSICGTNFIALDREEDQDLWADALGHGTHVTGTIVGNGAVTRSYAGMAPLVGDIRVAKVISRYNVGPFTAVNAGMDFLSEATECSAGGWSSDLVKPWIVNMSLSARALVFEGRDQAARKLDAVVWDHRQLYVVAQANASVHGFSNYGAAKNSLSVGAVLDSGELAAFSSHGPTADGRLAPLVAGTGVNLISPAGGGRPAGYGYLSGTSMAAPSVAGVAALLMEAVPAHREQPALTRARLMASAIKPDAWLEDASVFPTDNSSGPGTANARFGLGKVSAPTAVLARDRDDGWISGSATAVFEDGEYTDHDIAVPQGASRLDVVLTWDEPPADVIASTVLNDLDLWLDEGGDCADVPCGEYSSLSRRDNVEWIIVRNPTPGTWRVKVAATRVYTDAPRAALAWTVIRGPSTPELTVAADKDALDSSGEVAITVSANGYVAAGTRLQVECRTLAEQVGDEAARLAPCNASANVAVTNADGLDRPVVSVDPGGSVPLGDIAAGESRVVRFDGYPALPSAALHFTATAWNASAASVSVPMDADVAEEVTTVARPANDAFAAAEVLAGDRGSRQVDLLAATPEPGEPDYASGEGRPSGSVWYRWIAPATGPVHFGSALTHAVEAGTTANLDGWEMRVDVYEGDTLAGVRRVASSPWAASFFAVADTHYVVRLAAGNRAGRVALYWQRGVRPENDSFAAATAIAGETGSEAGTNLGATLDPGEYHGGLGGTVWYAWTAPSDGAWQFRSSAGQSKVLAFSGATLGDLRLVSGFPGAVVHFPARSGETYRIALAAADAFSAGSRFDLSWKSVELGADNDGMAGATALPGEEASSWSAHVDAVATVEPGEPPDSGVRTRWWSWTAPATGTFTWRLTGSPGLTLAAFSGDSLETLQSLGSARDTSIEFALGAVEDETYRFAAGIAEGHASAFTASVANGTVDFGPTPSNDAWSNATVLTASSGTVTGSNRFATTEPHERIWDVGHSSVWWVFEAPADGWFRFWVDGNEEPFTLSAYVHGTGSARELEMIVSSRRSARAGGVEIAVQVDAGERYAIRLGTFGNAHGTDFMLHWEETEAPNLLRYVGQFAPEADGDEIDRLGRMAFDSTGQALYVASPVGLSVLGRDAENGTLTSSQLLSGDQTGASMAWDRANSRLLVFKNCGAKSYEAVDDTYRRLSDAGALSVSGASPCIDGRVFMEGTFVYGIRARRDIKVYAVESGDSLRHVQTLEIPSVRDAVLSNAGDHVYAVEDYGLHALARDSTTGEITAAGQTSFAEQVYTLALSHDDAHVFTFGRIPAFVHDLDDPADPVLVGSLTPPTRYPFDLNCWLSIARNGRSAADAFCVNSAYAAQWESSTSQFQLADFVSSWQTNRYGELLPDFEWPLGLAASPDGRHAYVSTRNHGILIFERVGNPVVEVESPVEDGYVRLATIEVFLGRVGFGPLSSANCIRIKDLTVNGILYDVDTSKWQKRADANGIWADIADTGETGEICAYTPTDSGQYRLVVGMAIDGETGKYASNVLNHAAE